MEIIDYWNCHLVNLSNFSLIKSIMIKEKDLLHNKLFFYGYAVTYLHITKLFFPNHTIIDNQQKGKEGMPDFELYEDDLKTPTFVEFKSPNDCWRTNQILWMLKENRLCNKYLIICERIKDVSLSKPL